MPKLDWLKKEFHYGYDSGNILSIIPDKIRKSEEKVIGGSYRTVFKKAVLPYLKKNSKVLELGPGKGSWSRAILDSIPEGELTTIDFQDVSEWLHPEKYNGRLKCVRVEGNVYGKLPDDYFDLFWSFGVLCHNNKESIFQILSNSLVKVKKNGYAVHEYGDWDKLGKFGWEKGAIPLSFQNLPDDEIWWPRNSQAEMKEIAAKAGWEIITADLNLVKRDSIIVLQKK
ncbi:MAG TPA: methyltransferase domain-containing protein [Bacteroidia bacterium]